LSLKLEIQVAVAMRLQDWCGAPVMMRAFREQAEGRTGRRPKRCLRLPAARDKAKRLEMRKQSEFAVREQGFQV
jgi:hypothetical protein